MNELRVRHGPTPWVVDEEDGEKNDGDDEFEFYLDQTDFVDADRPLQGLELWADEVRSSGLGSRTCLWCAIRAMELTLESIDDRMARQALRRRR